MQMICSMQLTLRPNALMLYMRTKMVQPIGLLLSFGEFLKTEQRFR